MNLIPKRISLFLLAPMLLSACAAPPKEVGPNPLPATTQSQSGSSGSSASSGIAVGHDSTGSAADSGSSNADGSNGIKWTAPERWKEGPEKPMRSATYLIPAASGDPEGAECAVFENIGGGVQANIDRWIGQFEQPDGSASSGKAQQKKETINGFEVTTVALDGTFKGGGPMMGQSGGPKANYKLLGAIVETPQGEVFFKMTGPAKTMAAARNEFQALLKSLRK